MSSHLFLASTLGLMLSTGCMSLAVGGGAHAKVSDAPTRVTSGSFLFGGWYAFHEAYVLDLNMGIERGPLKKSNETLVMGGRFSSVSKGWKRPGLYGSFLLGSPIPSNDEDRPSSPRGGTLRWSSGVVWTKFSSAAASDRKVGEHQPKKYASILLGIAYHHQRQDNIGTGDFLGLELTFVGGADVGYFILEGTKGPDPSPRRSYDQ